MPTVGRVFAKKYNSPLRELVDYVNSSSRGGMVMKPNGAIDKGEKDLFTLTGVDYGVTWQAPHKTIVDAILTQGKSASMPKGAKPLNLDIYG